ncbi:MULTISPECIES: major capsid protein [unclassified Xanthomonas]|uniref:major capsid protein n=1 Tax=unclassified Xanthomonas TaxID=2643310 RepID=UPI002A80D7D9|nr:MULTISPECIES: major capsid protein [unclassified Xanthomonas]MDY4296824.1 major capsid protein [Xanthomonas sp. LF02-5]MDY4358417.1 major capsid protein [Xanthomonas sp. LF04-12]
MSVALMSDVFAEDAFSVTSLTDSINAMPFVPGRAGQVAGWEEEGVPTTSILIEEDSGELKLVNPTPRGGPGEAFASSTRKARSLVVPHYQVDDFIAADSVQNIRAFGQASQLEGIIDRVNARLRQHVQWKLDPTLEYQRVGAIKGLILNADGSLAYDLFTEFGVAQEAEIDFDLDNANPAPGALRRKCAGAVRKMADALGGVPVGGIHAFCGDNFFDEMLSHPEVRESYKGTPMAQVLRDGYVTPNGAVYGVFEFGGIIWENYRGKVGNLAFVDSDKCHLFPVGVPGLWRTIYAPADYEETVNTNGLPRYAKQYPSPNGKGRSLEAQMNALSYCVRPKALIKGKRT